MGRNCCRTALVLFIQALRKLSSGNFSAIYDRRIFVYVCCYQADGSRRYLPFGRPFLLEEKSIRYVLCVLLAATLHPYALMFLFVPIFTYKPWTKKTYFFIALFIVAGLALQPLMGTIINITTMIGEEYTVEEFSQAGVNIFRVLVCNVPLALSFVYRKQLFADSSREQNLFVNMAMLNGAIMFVGLFGTANYFGRLANYFLIFQILSLPWMVSKIQGRDRKAIKAAMIICYVAYFYYAHAINLPFDDNFHRYTISEYLAMPR